MGLTTVQRDCAACDHCRTESVDLVLAIFIIVISIHLNAVNKIKNMFD